MSVILGLNSFHAGSSAAILIDGQPVAAIAEERLNRKKYYAGFPAQAIRQCLEIAGVRFRDLDAVAMGTDPRANLAQKVKYTLLNPTKIPNLLKVRGERNKLNDVKGLIAAECGVDPAELRFQEHFVEHHLAHVASAYFISEWDKAAAISIDGSGDFVTTMFAECEGSDITIKRRIFLPHSLGQLYTMVSQFIGYTKYGDEGKVMGLAPFGKNTYQAIFDNMVRLTKDGFELDLRYFLPIGSDPGFVIDDQGEMIVPRQYSDEMPRAFGPPRERGAELTPRDMDMAFGLQAAFEKGYMHVLNLLHDLVPVDRLAMAGGCVLNSVANGKLFAQTPFKETCIQPAAGDEGLAMGAALYVSNCVLKEGRRYVMRDAYLGPEYTDAEIQAALARSDVKFTRHDRDALIRSTVDAMVPGNVVGWFQGRMEWGPRALGNRSIVVHPGLPTMKDTLNARIKRREWFRPFAPAVLAECQSEIFEHTHPSPYMLHVYKIRPEWRERLVAVNHVDDTGRLQSVARDENPLYYDLIKAFAARTGIPVILNTSFNENEPIVCTPSEAIDCFQRTKMDVLVIGSYLCAKTDGQNA
jgi:carbamoyltransferase